MPPVLHVSMPISIAEEGILPEDKICEICKKNLQANIREATTVLQEERVGEGEEDGRTKDKEENETMSKGKKQFEVLWIGDMLIMPMMIIRMAD